MSTLTELIRLVEENEGELDLRKIGEHLGAHPSAVAGMLETLIHKGRLIELRPTCGPCDSCGASEQCSLSATLGRGYGRFIAATDGDRVDPR